MNSSRSMSRDLDAGLTDGKYKKVATRERGGVVEATTALNRAGMDPGNVLADWYGEGVEDPIKIRPDGRPSRA
jgi:hypothetical protein